MGATKKWFDEFTLAVVFKTLDIGKEIADPQGTDRSKIKIDTCRFTEEAKTIVMLRCIGSDGRPVLASEGYMV